MKPEIIGGLFTDVVPYEGEILEVYVNGERRTKPGYGDKCGARFWPTPHELACVLPPGHEGEHAIGEDSNREIISWAIARPGVILLLLTLRAANYDESSVEYLRRIVTGRGADGERSEPPEERRWRSFGKPERA